MPEMNDLVPSIGSSTQTYSASARSLPYSSPTMPCSGKVALDQRAHGVLGGAVGRRHRIEARRRALVLDAERGAEERQDRLARHGRELVDEGGKIDGRHACPGSASRLKESGARGTAGTAATAGGFGRKGCRNRHCGPETVEGGNVNGFPSCILCAAVYVIAARYAICVAYRRPPWAFPP